MADELSLEPKQDIPEDVKPAAAAAPSETFTKDEVLAQIEQAKEEAIRRATQDAFRQSQAKTDKDIARVQADTRSQYTTLMERYNRALLEHGAEPEAIEGLQRQTQTDLEMQELRQKAGAYEHLKAQIEADQAKEDYIKQVCADYKIDRYHTDLKADLDQSTFDRSVLDILARRLERQEKDAQRETKKQGLEHLQAAGALDVTGGGAAMAPPAWSTSKLVAGSQESIIAGHLIHYFGTLAPAELGQKILKTQQLMKSEPRLAGQLKDAARRVWEQELAR